MDPEKLDELNELEAIRNSEASPKVKKIQQILHYDGVNVTPEQIAAIEGASDDNNQLQPDWAIMCKLYNAYEWVVWSLKSKFYAADHSDNTQITDDITQVGEAPVVTDTLREFA